MLAMAGYHIVPTSILDPGLPPKPNIFLSILPAKDIYTSGVTFGNIDL